MVQKHTHFHRAPLSIRTTLLCRKPRNIASSTLQKHYQRQKLPAVGLVAISCGFVTWSQCTQSSKHFRLSILFIGTVDLPHRAISSAFEANVTSLDSVFVYGHRVKAIDVRTVGICRVSLALSNICGQQIKLVGNIYIDNVPWSDLTTQKLYSTIQAAFSLRSIHIATPTTREVYLLVLYDSMCRSSFIDPILPSCIQPCWVCGSITATSTSCDAMIRSRNPLVSIHFAASLVSVHSACKRRPIVHSNFIFSKCCS